MSPLFGLRRDRRQGPDVWLPLKMSLFVAGAASAVAGMALGRDWLITVAIVLLALGILLRFITVRRADADVRPDDDLDEPPSAA